MFFKNRFFSSILLALIVDQIHHIYGQFQPQSSSQSSQYPRIKIGGPLGQLIPNGFQLGAGLGSVINQLIGQSGSESSAQSSQQSTSISSPFGALRSPFAALQSQFAPQLQQQQVQGGQGGQGGQAGQGQGQSQGQLMSSLYQSMGSQSALNPYANLFSSGSSISTSGSKPFSPFSQQMSQNLYNSDTNGLYGSASSPLGLSHSGPLMGHSSQLGSTNSELFSNHNSNLNSNLNLGID